MRGVSRPVLRGFNDPLFRRDNGDCRPARRPATSKLNTRTALPQGERCRAPFARCSLPPAPRTSASSRRRCGIGPGIPPLASVCTVTFSPLLFEPLSPAPPPAPQDATLTATQAWCVRLATPLLLFGADMRRLVGSAGRLTGAFALGAAGSTLGILGGFALVAAPMALVGDPSNGDGWKLASALLAKNIGGGINYVAVAATTGVSSSAVAAGLAVDNLFGLLYFPLVNWIGSRHAADAGGKSTETAAAGAAARGAGKGSPEDPPVLPEAIIAERVGAGEAASTSGGGGGQQGEFGSVEDCLTAIAVACAASALSEAIAPAASMPVATALTGARAGVDASLLHVAVLRAVLHRRDFIGRPFLAHCSAGRNGVSGGFRKARAVRDFLGQDPPVRLLCKVRSTEPSPMTSRRNGVARDCFSPTPCSSPERALRSAGAAGGAIDVVGSFLPLFPMLAVLYATHLGLMLGLGPRLGFTVPGMLMTWHGGRQNPTEPANTCCCGRRGCFASRRGVFSRAQRSCWPATRTSATRQLPRRSRRRAGARTIIHCFSRCLRADSMTFCLILLTRSPRHPSRYRWDRLLVPGMLVGHLGNAVRFACVPGPKGTRCATALLLGSRSRRLVRASSNKRTAMSASVISPPA